MADHWFKISLSTLVTCVTLIIGTLDCEAQTKPTANDTMNIREVGTIKVENTLTSGDSLALQTSDDIVKKKRKRDWTTWRPDTKKALWLAIALPGAGQIYNRKYWKVPIVYGGFVGCVYAITWNNMMYHQYSQAYMDIMDDDPNTQSYNQFLHLGVTISESDMSYYQTIFQKRKDTYRKWRDLSVFCLIGVYALSIIDAYVDASLSQFDISPNLSLNVQPSIMNNAKYNNPLKASSVGVRCDLNF